MKGGQRCLLVMSGNSFVILTLNLRFVLCFYITKLYQILKEKYVIEVFYHLKRLPYAQYQEV